jgi:hypothetical protein
MKTLIVLLLVGAGIALIVTVLGSTLSPAQHSPKDAGIAGALAIGATSRAKEPIPVWREARGSISAEDRVALRAGTLDTGDRFKILNHMIGEVLWVEIQGVDDPELRGWLRSPPDEPVHATRIE